MLIFDIDFATSFVNILHYTDPAGTTKGFEESPLISIETSPVDTRRDLAPIITNTSARTIPENETTPSIKSICISNSY